MHWLAPFATDVNLHVKELRAIEVLFLSASLAPSTANLVGWELSCSLLLSTMFDRSTTSARLSQQSDEQLCNSDLRCEEQEDQQCDFVEKARANSSEFRTCVLEDLRRKNSETLLAVDASIYL